MNGTEPERTSGRVRTVLSHLAKPADDWAYRSDERQPSVLLSLMSALLVLLALVAIAAVGLAYGIGHHWLFIAQLVLLGVASAIVAVLMYQVRQHLLTPLAQIYTWALQMCDGDFSARIVSPAEGCFAKLSFHVNRLSEALDRLANQMDDMVVEQTERLHEKNQSLEVLYEKTRNLALVNERTALAHELHDSLAQTIAALRFQVNNLDDSMTRADVLASKRDLRKINAGIEAANTEVRDLIANFRAPIDERSLLSSIEDMVSRFERESAMTVYLHTEGEMLTLSPVAEVQFLGVVREGLANARKHSGAKLVRILLHARADGFYRLLIEDDGIGFDENNNNAERGEHIGLSIMHDRAERLGCKLKIESEPGEGTRLDLTFAGVASLSESLSRVN